MLNMTCRFFLKKTYKSTKTFDQSARSAPEVPEPLLYLPHRRSAGRSSTNISSLTAKHENGFDSYNKSNICVILSIIGRKGFGMSRLMDMLAGVSLNLLQAVDNTTPLFLCLQVLPLRRTVSSPPLSLGRQALRVLTV